MLGELMSMMAKMSSFDELVMVLEDHIKMYKEGHKNGKDFLTKTCSLIITKTLQENGMNIDDVYKGSLEESKDDSISEDMPEDLKKLYSKIKRGI